MKTKFYNELLGTFSEKQKEMYMELVKMFHNNIKHGIEHGTANEPYYRKAFMTMEIAKNLNLPCAECRKTLNSLEKRLLVNSNRDCNTISWAANYIEGYKQHKFHDYYEPIV